MDYIKRDIEKSGNGSAPLYPDAQWSMPGRWRTKMARYNC